ncbi:MAG: hypothetical protein ABI395_02835 [Sphingobium sp.]
MNHWPFIIAAYAITLLGTTFVSWASWRMMVRAERAADALRRDRDAQA